MYFLIQSNIYSDPDHDKVFDVLEELNLEYEKIHLDQNLNKIQLNINRNDVFVYGSVKLARLAKKNKDWFPGSFYGGNHLFEVYSEYYKDNLLNYEYEVYKFNEKFKWEIEEEKFIKPFIDAKIFTGKIFTKTEWNDFVHESLEKPKTPLLNSDSLVQVSKPKYISKEARLWIVGKEIIDGVYYKFHESEVFESEVSPEGIEFAKRMVSTFSVEDAFVMDICYTLDGWKIVEINCINSAGFYPNLNIKSLFKALDLYFST